MTHPPNHGPIALSGDKLLKIFNSPAFQQQLSKCTVERAPEPQHPWLDSQRKKESVRYFDANGTEIAVLFVYTDHPPGTNIQTVIIQLLADDQLYVVALFQ